MKIYIDQIDEKTIHIKEINNGGISILDNNFFATFKASIGKDNTVTINDMVNNGMNLSFNLSELYINGSLSPQNMDDAIKALTFIGSFKQGGGASTETPIDEEQIRQIVQDELQGVVIGTIPGAVMNSFGDSTTNAISQAFVTELANNWENNW